MWGGSNCHTLDRMNFEAQLECGIGLNNGVLGNLTQSNFNLTYFPYIQGENYECMQNFVYDSHTNVFYSGSLRLIAGSSAAVISMVALYLF